MAGYAVIGLEGVLAQDKGTFPAAAPIPGGVLLYAALRTSYKVVILTDSDVEMAATWLSRHRIAGYVSIQPRDSLESLRSAGYAVDLVVDASPDRIAQAMKLGMPGLLFAHPSFARPEFRPDAQRGIREWSVMQEEIDLQASLYDAVAKTADLAD